MDDEEEVDIDVLSDFVAKGLPDTGGMGNSTLLGKHVSQQNCCLVTVKNKSDHQTGYIKKILNPLHRVVVVNGQVEFPGPLVLETKLSKVDWVNLVEAAAARLGEGGGGEGGLVLPPFLGAGASPGEGAVKEGFLSLSMMLGLDWVVVVFLADNLSSLLSRIC